MNSKKRVLGRGLSAILSSPETDITSKDISGDFVAGAIAEINIERIDANPFQPRDIFEEEALKELADSIAEQGIIQPVTVRKLGYDRYQLITGERRLRAAIMAGLEKVPAYIRVANDQQMLELALVENIQRQDLNPLAVAISFQRLIEECKLTQEQLSDRVGKSRSNVANHIRLLKLPVEIQIALRDNKISMGHARAMINVSEPQIQIDILNKILAEGLSVRQVEEIVRKLSDKTSNPVKPSKQVQPEKLIILKNTLLQRLSTPVKIKMNNKGKGQIVIEFNDEQELERIAGLLNK
ncbi:MAG: ParB/RepB/Spo0J family partition protein [Bacteroidales bacterium]|jgi:ParB family chromosome partitioning protein|nr:ParB/RepB/Spo0J family partition protein [Bacteroidales bacterium]